MRYLKLALAKASLAALISTVLIFQPVAQSDSAQPATTLPPDLALVPPNALGFVHVRGADLWKNEVFAGFRATFEKAGPKAIAALDNQFVPKPSTLGRLTAFLLMDERNQEPVPFVVVNFSVPFEIAEVVTAYLPKASAEKVNGKTLYRSESTPLELYFPDHQNIVMSMPGGMTQFLKHDSPKTGPLSFGLNLAASGKPVVASVNIPALPIPKEELKFLPGEVKTLLKAEHATASLDLAATARVTVVAGYKNPADAQDAEQSIKKLADLGRKELAKVKEEVEKKLFDPMVKTPRSPTELPETLLSVFALGAINEADELLANPGALVKREGTDLSASFALPKELIVTAGGLTAAGVGLLLPAVQKVRVAAARAQTQNNLKQLALACHNYNDAFGHFPQDILDKNGKPLLSWRVAILPFIEQNALYKQFKLDEPWDSENNKKWSEIAIKTYMSPFSNPTTPPGMTQYKGFVGPGAMFERGKPLKIIDISDGLSNTILAVEAGEPIPWAKPGDIPFDPKQPLPKLALPGVEDIINVAMCDGSVRAVLTKSVSEKTMKNAIMRNDGNPLGADW